ncbi:MAG: HupE/UreJ family protein [Rhodobiaceae bacterium]|nr:HupE/UreJ family protein [Paracoccaceae bacterium]MCB1473223.1 HupE/UreJ family protein [Rhodobiaceae bacterium]
MKKATVLAAALAASATLAGPALAHTGGDVAGLHAGIVHPILGADHLLAMLAVGIWSAAQPVRKAWHAPAAFLALLAIGAVLGMAGVAFPMVEPGILASVVVIGLLAAFARTMPETLALMLIGGFALFHGHAHGAEATGALGGYMTGFLAASATLHLGGYGVGRLASRLRYGLIGSGLAVSAAGLALMAT